MTVQTKENYKLPQWLESLPGVSSVAPITLVIGREVFSGARYVNTRHYDAGMAVVQRGEHKAGDAYTQEFIYLLGALPKAYQRTTRVAFTMPGDARDWYVACYHDGRDAPHKPPFTPNFMLAPWTSAEPIDYYEIMEGKKPRPRIAMVPS